MEGMQGMFAAVIHLVRTFVQFFGLESARKQQRRTAVRLC